jgi:pre-mRNA-splicing factor SYF1
MLRIKRSVQSQYNTDIGYVAAASGQAEVPIATNGAVEDGDPMASLERNAPLTGFVESSAGPVGGGASTDKDTADKSTPVDTVMDNPDAIELGEDDDMQEA